MERTFHVAGYAVVDDRDGRVLLCRRRGEASWVLPGGSCEPGEPPWEAVVRETREETGVTVVVEGLVGVYVARRENDLVFAFRCRHEEGAPSPSEERAEVRWVDPGSLPPELSDRDRERIADALEHDRPRLRARPGGQEPPPAGVR